MPSLKFPLHADNYLINQRGELYHLKDDRVAWHQAYYQEIVKTLTQLRQVTCRPPQHVLDIGAGVGVIDAMLIQNWGSHCTLVDGEDGDGVATEHAVPYGSRAVTSEFMNANGLLGRYTYCNPDQLRAVDTVFDLVISFRSWCFHYPPEAYLSYVQTHVAPTGLIVVDVRKGKGWRDRLDAIWRTHHVLDESDKFERMLYAVEGRIM